MLRYREVSETDRSQISDWIAADEDHRNKCDADFWLAKEPGVKLFAVEDSCGTIFYVRGESLLRLHIQFAPDQKVRTAKAIDEFTELISAGAKKQNYKQLIFESTVAPLVRFLNKRGFRKSENEYVRDLV